MSGRMAWIGRRVRLRTSMGERQGLFAGLAPDGGLVLIPSFEADEAGTQEKEVFHSGSLFLD